MSFFTEMETDTAVKKIKNSGSKEILKLIGSKLKSEKPNVTDFALTQLIDAFINFTEAAKDMYAPNIMRYMMSRDSYIKELIAAAEKMQTVDLPNANKAAESVTATKENSDLLHEFLISLIAFQERNIEKQLRISSGKGDMVENTTHDIMKKYMKKDFNDVAELVTPLIKTLESKLIAANK